jgi:ornithine cyclodeaminase/alanine dehydrogenase-like protein (mu-crystallin family)
MSGAGGIPFLDAGAIAAALSPVEAVDALEAALRGGLDPEADPPRGAVGAEAGEVLLMPSTAPGAVGVKLVTVAPGNPARGRPRIQGVYVLFDSETLAPAALLDGIGLTNLRTAAVSALAVRHLAARGARRLLVFGTGAQAWAHVGALRAVRPGLDRVDVVARDAGRLEAFVSRCAREHGVDACVAGPDAIAGADVVVCATTAREPVFDGADVGDTATVVAIGSHEPEAREVDDRLAGRATVVVESRSSALREAGDVIAAVEAGALDPATLVPLAALVTGEARPDDGSPRLFKSTGMAWEDLVVAAAVAAHASGDSTGGGLTPAPRDPG